MADEQSKTPADVQADALADELLSAGSFEDVAGAQNSAVSSPPANVAAAPIVDPAAASTASAEASSGAPGLAELEALLKQASFDDPGAVAGQHTGGDSDMASQLIAEAQAAARQSASAKPLPATQPFDLPAFQQALTESQASSIDLLRDVELNVKIELGRSRMLVEDVLKLSEGAVVELDKLAGDPVDVFVNDRLVARGEVLVLNDNFCVRVNEIVATVKEEV